MEAGARARRSQGSHQISGWLLPIVSSAILNARGAVYGEVQIANVKISNTSIHGCHGAKTFETPRQRWCFVRAIAVIESLCHEPNGYCADSINSRIDLTGALPYERNWLLKPFTEKSLPSFARISSRNAVISA